MIRRRDVEILRQFGNVFGGETLTIVRITTTLLQRAVAKSFTARAIASILCRDDLLEPSPLEKLISRTRMQLSSSLSSSSTRPMSVVSSPLSLSLTSSSSSSSSSTSTSNNKANQTNNQQNATRTSTLAAALTTSPSNGTSSVSGNVVTGLSVDDEVFFAAFEKQLDEMLDEQQNN